MSAMKLHHSNLIYFVYNLLLLSDSLLRLWRVFPFAEESLAPLIVLQCTSLPTHIAAMANLLFISFEETKSVMHMLTVYNTSEKGEYRIVSLYHCGGGKKLHMH